MRLALVATDTAPSQAFKKLDAIPPIAMVKFLGEQAEVFCQADSSDFDLLLCGMSSSPVLSRWEIMAAEKARRQGTPYGFYADTFGAINRAWFEHLRDGAAFVFVINEKEAADARKLFPNSRVVASGNPNWDDFFYPKMAKETIRRRLGIHDRQRMILCPGGKVLMNNAQHFGGVVSAATMLYRDPGELAIVISVHPGDESFRKDPSVYNDIAKYSKVPVFIVPKERISGSELVAGADVVVDAGSTVAIEAVCQRKPVITFFVEGALCRLEEQIGRRKWDLCEQGVSKEVLYNPFELYQAIWDALAGKDETAIRRLQEDLYPLPSSPGKALRTISETLLEFAPK